MAEQLPISSEPPVLLGMTSASEQAFYRTLAQVDVQGVGEIVDLGCWLGSTTQSLLLGLSQNPNPQARARKVFAYDNFRWEDYMNGPIQGTDLEGKFRVGNSFLPEFKRRLGDWAPQVEIRAGNLCAVGWTGEPIELLLVDAMKSAALANCIWHDFYSCLIPGRSIVVHQDFIHYYEMWIHIIHYRLREYFEPIGESKDSTTLAFRYIHPIPEQLFKIPWHFPTLTDAEIDAAFDYSFSITSAPKRANVAAAHVMAYLHLRRSEHAQALFKEYLKQGYSINSDLSHVQLWMERYEWELYTNAPSADLTASRDSAVYALRDGLTFLKTVQLPSGAFRMDSSGKLDQAKKSAFDLYNLTPIISRHIANSLDGIAHADAPPLINQTLNYLRAQMDRHGLWQSEANIPLPPRLDDLACNSQLLRKHHWSTPNNRWLILLNRNSQGLFYTWMLPRLVFTRNWTYWKIVLDPKRFKQAFGLKQTIVHSDEIDAVVNTNVLIYLGRRANTAPVIDWLIQIVRERREAACNHWHDPLFFYYVLSQAYKSGLDDLQTVANIIAARLAEVAQADGRIGGNALQTAFAINTFYNFRLDSPLMEPAIAFLLASQKADGSWEAAPFYRTPEPDMGLGSEALTTAFCLEALTKRAKLEIFSQSLLKSRPNHLQLLKLLGMTSWYERTHYEEIASGVMQGAGEIVDLGCWLGSTTVSLARGLAHNKAALAQGRKIFAYDHFVWEDYMHQIVSGTELEGRYKPGDSFLDEFKQRVHQWTDIIELRPGDLLTQDWTGAPIEVLLVDIMKTQELANVVLTKFYPYLIPGLSLVIHQDFAHFYLWWIHIIHYRLRDYFEVYADIQKSGTITFRYIRPIPKALLTTSWDFQAADDSEIDQAYAYCLGLTQEPFKRGQIAGAHVVAYLDRQNWQRAREVSDQYIKQGLSVEAGSGLQAEFIDKYKILKNS